MHLNSALRKGPDELTKTEFVRGWGSLTFLYPGLHPDGFASHGSGWPKRFKPLAAEAWQRFEAGELTDNELYCYQAAKARVGKVRDEVQRTLLMADYVPA